MIIERWLARMSLEQMLCDPLAFALTTASPLQRAICRIAEGVPLGLLAQDPTVRRALGATVGLSYRPREVAVVAGVRTGKSLLAAAMGVHAALRCDVSALRPGEVPRVAIVSTKLDNADVVYKHLKGHVCASPVLRSCLLSDPETSSSSLLLRHPSGRPIEVCTVAGSKAGSSLVSRWMAAVIFDEYARMTGDSSEGIVNWTDSRRAVMARILPGGYLAHITSPWAPFGPAYTHVQQHWGAPSPELVVLKARADELNPAYWTPERVAAAEASDPDVYRTDVLAEFSSPEEALYSADHIEACTRQRPLERASQLPDGASYTAAMDPATRGNGWSFVVATREGRKRIVVLAREWIGSRACPLSPDAVLSEIAAACRPYGIRDIDTDQWSGDALSDIAGRHGLTLHAWTTPDRLRTERYLAIRTMLAMGEVELPPVAQLRTDLLRLRKRITQSGTSIVLPQTSDGRHCDYAPALMLALSRYIDDVPAAGGDPVKQEADRMREAAIRSVLGANDDDE